MLTRSEPTSPKTWTSAAESPAARGGAAARGSSDDHPILVDAHHEIGGAPRWRTPCGDLDSHEIGEGPCSSCLERVDGEVLAREDLTRVAREDEEPLLAARRARQESQRRRREQQPTDSGIGPTAGAGTHYDAGRTSRRVGRPSCLVRRKSSVRAGSDTKSHISQRRL